MRIIYNNMTLQVAGDPQNDREAVIQLPGDTYILVTSWQPGDPPQVQAFDVLSERPMGRVYKATVVAAS